MGPSRHDAGRDLLTSQDDLHVALGVRLRQQPGSRWMVEMHPETSRDFDRADFDGRFGPQDVRLYESRYIPRGEYRLSQRSSGAGGRAP